MKSHLIPDPNPNERYLSSTDAARMYLLDQLFTGNKQRSEIKSTRKDDSRPTPEMPMRNFLHVVFVG